MGAVQIYFINDCDMAVLLGVKRLQCIYGVFTWYFRAIFVTLLSDVCLCQYQSWKIQECMVISINLLTAVDIFVARVFQLVRMRSFYNSNTIAPF